MAEFKTVDSEVLKNGYHLAADEKIVTGQNYPNTVAPVGVAAFDGSSVNQTDRWAVTPLYTTNHEYALTGEYLCDPNTGEPAIKREDGTVINVSEIARINYHLETFSTALSYLGMRTSKIFSIVPDIDDHVFVYDGNGLDDEIVLESDSQIKKAVISFDISVLEKVEGSNMLRMIDRDPVVNVEYTIGAGVVTRTVSLKASDFNYNTIPINDKSFTLKAIRFPQVDASGYTCFIHSIFVAY